MEREVRIFTKLKTHLNDIRQKLYTISSNSIWMEDIFTKEKFRSCIAMKNLLQSVVTKTMAGKQSEEDIVSVSGEQTLHPKLDSFINSEEYLNEATNFSKQPPNLSALIKSLIVFQEFLADILHTVCNLSNHKMKFPSGILVKDVLEVNNHYSSISDLVLSLFNRDKNKIFSSEFDAEKLQTQITSLQKTFQLCLKEMSIIKLHIEHYFKHNLIEMQLFDTEIQKNSNKIKLNDNKTATNQAVNSSSFDRSIKYTGAELKACDPPDTLFTEIIYPPTNFDNILNVYSLPPKFVNQDKCTPENQCADFFYNQVIFPADYLFLDPTSIYIDPLTNTQKQHSLPKIYSIDSIKNEETNKEYSKKGNYNYSTKEMLDRTQYGEERKLQNKLKPISKDLSDVNEEGLFFKDEDLFSNRNKQCEEKVSSLFDGITTSSKEREDVENIFNVNLIKPQVNADTNSKLFVDISNSQPKRKFKRISNDKNFEQSFKNSFSYNSRHIETKQFSNKTQQIIEDKGKNQINKNSYSSKTQVKTKAHNEPHKGVVEDVIYDKKSLIEIFHKKDDNNSNAGSSPEDENTFSLWPVTAEYIHVSKEQSPNRSYSASHDGTVPVSKFKSFEKSYFSLHMNRKYEQKQVYKGDLLVLESFEPLVHERQSDNTLFNQPYTGLKDNRQRFNKTKEEFDSIFNKVCAIKDPNSIDNRKALIINNWDKKSKYKIENKHAEAVHCSTLGTPLREHRKHFINKFDFFQPNKHKNCSNWNSFISVFTSNLLPQTQINHQRMFRKVINTYESESLTCNILGNVHTLTSNGGPFRLFDINGYPLTDSSGNVLKDPYGKSVVILDSTGLPLDDIKVFDAAGNTPKNIKFDPTQKPKTNSIIIKLTDNFKRPLHLFDKYGRPLTDSFGKLLVNIHGRPLLRFDNFGRPNTDYRGGPLYTENGQRWSHKTTELLPNEQNSSETLPGSVHLHMVTEKESDGKIGEKTTLKEKDSNTTKIKGEDIIPPHLFETKTAFLDKSPDIWARVETVLQQFPKRKLTESKVSQASIIINSVTVKQNQNPLEKDMLKSIIYHDNIMQKDIDPHHTVNFEPREVNDGLYSTLVKPKNDLFLEKLTPCAKKYNPQVMTNYTHLESNHCNFYGKLNTTPYGIHYDNAKLHHNDCLNPKKNACSVCFLGHNKPHPQNGVLKTNQNFFNNPVLSKPRDLLLKNNFIPANENILKDESFYLEKPFLQKEDWVHSLYKSNRPTIGSCQNSYPQSNTQNTSSYFTFKNHDYLNNLCNQILKQQISYQDRIKSSVRQELMKTNNNLTDTTLSPFSSSKESKFTTDLMTRTESPFDFSDTCRKISKEIKDLKSYENSYKNRIATRKSVRRDKSCGDCAREKICFDSAKDTTSYNERSSEEKSQSKNLQVSSNDTAVAISVLNQEDQHYEIKVTETPNKVVKPKMGLNLFSLRKNNNLKSNIRPTCTKVDKHSSGKNLSSEKILYGIEGRENNYARKKTKEKIYTSPYRFPSDEHIYSTLAEIRSSEDKKCKSDSNVSIDHKDFNCAKDGNQQFFQQDVLSRGKNYLKTTRVREQNKDSKGGRKDQVLNARTSGKKDLTTKKKPSGANRECNFASFFGSPVKYVLKKLDSKRSSKLNNNEMNGLTQNDTNKINKTKSCPPKLPETSKNMHDIKVKTLFDITRSSNRSIISSNEKTEINNVKTGRYHITAFQSKSCVDLVDEMNSVRMSYSGKNIHENEKAEKNCQGSNKTKLQRSSSTSSITTPEIYEAYNRSCRNSKELSNPKQKIQQYSFKSNTYKRNNNDPDYISGQNSKDAKKHLVKQYRSPFFTKTKSKSNKNTEISLFKKVEPEGKYMLKVKNRKRHG